MDRKKLLALLLFLLLIAPPLWATIVNTNAKAAQGSANPENSGVFTSALTNPSIIIDAVGRASNAAITPTDVATNSYGDCGPGSIAAGIGGAAGTIQCFYALNTHTTASNNVHQSNAVGDYVNNTALEFTGVVTSSPVDGGSAAGYNSTASGSTGTGGGQNVSAGALSTSTNGDLIYACATGMNGTMTANTGGGYTSTAVPGSMACEYLVQATHGAITPTFSDNTNSDTYGAFAVAFKAAAGGTVKPAIPYIAFREQLYFCRLEFLCAL